jgi:hypothetical protein
MLFSHGADGTGAAEHIFEVQVTGTAAELQLSAVQTGTSVALRIELAIMGGSTIGAAEVARAAKPIMANRTVDFLNGCALVGR